MKKSLLFLLVLIITLLVNIAFSSGSYDFQDASSDAETVRAFFSGEVSFDEAAAAYERLYDFLYKDSQDYVLNKNKGKFHFPNCPSVTKQMKESNKIYINCSRELVISFGYESCGNCHP